MEEEPTYSLTDKHFATDDFRMFEFKVRLYCWCGQAGLLRCWEACGAGIPPSWRLIRARQLRSRPL